MLKLIKKNKKNMANKNKHFSKNIYIKNILIEGIQYIIIINAKLNI